MGASFEAPAAVRWSGAVVASGGLVLLAVVHAHLAENFSPYLRIRHDHRLVTSGPYSRVRHPMYTAFLLLLGGFTLLTANGFLAVAFVLMMAALLGHRLPARSACSRCASAPSTRPGARRRGCCCRGERTARGVACCRIPAEAAASYFAPRNVVERFSVNLRARDEVDALISTDVSFAAPEEVLTLGENRVCLAGSTFARELRVIVQGLGTFDASEHADAQVYGGAAWIEMARLSEGAGCGTLRFVDLVLGADSLGFALQVSGTGTLECQGWGTPD